MTLLQPVRTQDVVCNADRTGKGEQSAFRKQLHSLCPEHGRTITPAMSAAMARTVDSCAAGSRVAHVALNQPLSTAPCGVCNEPP